MSAAAGSWARSFRDVAREHALEPIRVEGALPAGLAGTFYRNGPGRVGYPGDRYAHWFDGDGAVTAVRLENGRAEGAVRLVRTPGLARQDRAQRLLFGGYNTPLRRPLREIFLDDDKNPANTSVMIWQHRLFALCEAGLPFEIDRDTLATLGERSLGGVLSPAFSAHPHVVPQRRAVYGFGLRNGPRATITAYELPFSGRARRLTSFKIPGPTLMHDFAATARHLVFFVPPMRMRILPVLFGQLGPVDALEWRAEKGAEIVIVPLDDPEKIVRFGVEAHMIEHVANAYEDRGSILIDAVKYADMHGLERYVGKLIDGRVNAPLGSAFTRLIIDPAARTLRFEDRLVAPCELPRVSPRVDAAPHRFVYIAGFTSDEAARTGLFDAILKLDATSGKVDRFPMDPGRYAGEPVFIPRSAGTAEDDGWILTLVYDAPSDTTHLAVIDARAPGSPPLARAHFDHPIPPGFHGVWAPA